MFTNNALKGSKKIRTLFIITLYIFSHFARAFNLALLSKLPYETIYYFNLRVDILTYKYKPKEDSAFHV
jgi:hypothetical protein